jgi:haloalkane dehalogenase
MKAGLIVAAILISLATALVIQVTRDGELVIPEGADVITVGTDQFASFPLPEYVTNQLSIEYKSYFVEVEPGIKIHVLETGTGYPVLLQHGNPTTC